MNGGATTRAFAVSIALLGAVGAQQPGLDGMSFEQLVAAADAALQAGKVEAASGLALAASAMQPQRHEPVIVLAMARAEAGELAEADRLMRDAFTKAPRTVRTGIARLRCELRGEDAEGAVTRLVEAARRDRAAGLLAAAADGLEAAWWIQHERPELALEAADCLLELDRVVAAMTLLRDIEYEGDESARKTVAGRLSMLAPLVAEHSRSMRARAATLASEGNFLAAAEIWEQLLVLTPSEPELAFERVLALGAAKSGAALPALASAFEYGFRNDERLVAAWQLTWLFNTPALLVLVDGARGTEVRSRCEDRYRAWHERNLAVVLAAVLPGTPLHECQEALATALDIVAADPGDLTALAAAVHLSVRLGRSEAAHEMFLCLLQGRVQAGLPLWIPELADSYGDPRVMEFIVAAKGWEAATSIHALYLPQVDGCRHVGITATGYLLYEHRATGLSFVLIREGMFRRPAANEAQVDGLPRRSPAAAIRTGAFLIAMSEVPAERVRDTADQAVHGVSWTDASDWCAKTGLVLPTEAEWIRAALLDAGGENVDGAAMPVGALGIVGMRNESSEWCADWYGPLEGGELLNPAGPGTGDRRVLKGGRTDRAHVDAFARDSAPPDTRIPAALFRPVLRIGAH